MALQDEAPKLSTPATHIFEEQADSPPVCATGTDSQEQLSIIYEIQRTITEIRLAKYKRIALQFPDGMLLDAPRVFDALKDGLRTLPSEPNDGDNRCSIPQIESADHNERPKPDAEGPETKFFILGDTSYGACCVDEVAAEHVDADVIVHYGRSCLSPSARIPVIHVFTVQPLSDQAKLVREFEELYSDCQHKIILMADVTYQKHIEPITKELRQRGYCNLHVAQIVHDPSSTLPNRTVPEEVTLTPSKLRDWHLFHISDPPESLLLTLSSHLKQFFVYSVSKTGPEARPRFDFSSTHRALNRRYALLTSVNTVSIFGILINTLSVKNYMHIADHVKSQILRAGKKSYTFVVGKVNAAKVANFGEIGAWVVIGCWESSLINSTDFWKPVLTPYELELALMTDSQRVWTGHWRSDFQYILDKTTYNEHPEAHISAQSEDSLGGQLEATEDDDCESEPESTPPDFDLRTGRYVSHARPMKSIIGISDNTNSNNQIKSHSLAKRIKGEITAIGGAPSPAAEYLRTQRIWKGLGSDYEIAYEDGGSQIEEGTKGIARGYRHGQNDMKI